MVLQSEDFNALITQLKQHPVLIGVAWPYANANTLHVGHVAGAYLSADIFGKFMRAIGAKVLQVSGTDMHGTPVSVKAMAAGLDPKTYAFENHKAFVNQLKALDFEYEHYTNTHNKLHFEVVNNIGRFLYKAGFLFPKTSKMFYDPKAKKYLPDRYVEGTCPYCGYSPARGDQCDGCGRVLDPLELKDPKSKLTGITPEVREVTNLYLDLPKLESFLKKYIKAQKHWKPHVLEFTLGWLKEGLKARPVTRNLDWGIPVEIPGFEDQVWYVWFEAVIGYLSAAIAWSYLELPKDFVGLHQGNPQSKNQWQEFWKNPKAQHYYFIGKDNIPFHSVIWPAQIMAYNHKYANAQDSSDFEEFKLPAEDSPKELNLPYFIAANHYVMINGQKLSKSLGNFIGMDELLANYSTDQIRYALSRLLPETKDANFTMDRFKELINNEFVATIGNLVYRVFSFSSKNFDGALPGKKHGVTGVGEPVMQKVLEIFVDYVKFMSEVKLSAGLEKVLELARFGNQYFNESAPWKQEDKNPQAVFDTAFIAVSVATLLYPFVPGFTKKVFKGLGVEANNVSTMIGSFEFDVHKLLDFAEPGLVLKEVTIVAQKVES